MDRGGERRERAGDPIEHGVRHRLEFWLIAVVTALVRVSPWPVARAAGTVVGLLFYLFDAPHRRIALDNLARAFPARGRARAPDDRAAASSRTSGGC